MSELWLRFVFEAFGFLFLQFLVVAGRCRGLLSAHRMHEGVEVFHFSFQNLGAYRPLGVPATRPVWARMRAIRLIREAYPGLAYPPDSDSWDLVICVRYMFVLTLGLHAHL